jgi:hypothetical protein
LRSITLLRRHHQALTALWEGAGLLRATPDLRATLSDVCQRIAAALELEWLALIGLDERQIPAPFLFARGNGQDHRPGCNPCTSAWRLKRYAAGERWCASSRADAGISTGACGR